MKRGWRRAVLQGSLVLAGWAGHEVSLGAAEQPVVPAAYAEVVRQPPAVAPDVAADPAAGTGAKGLSSGKRPWSGWTPSKFTRGAAEAGKKTASADASKLEGQVSIARLAERRGQTAQAEEMFRELVAKHPEHPVPPHRLAVMAARRGDLDEASQFFQTASRLAPRNPELLSDAGYCAYLQNRHDEAERLYRQGLAIDPKHEALCNNLALLLAETGRTEESLQVFRRANTPAQAHANLAFMLVQTGQLEQAETHFNRALTLDPTQRRAALGYLQLAELKEKADRVKSDSHRATPGAPREAGGPSREAAALPHPAPAATLSAAPPQPVSTQAPAPVVARNPAVAPPQSAPTPAPQTAPALRSAPDVESAPAPTREVLAANSESSQAPLRPAKSIRLTSQEEPVVAPPAGQTSTDARAAKTTATQAPQPDPQPAVVPAVDMSPRRRRVGEAGSAGARAAADRTARDATVVAPAATASSKPSPDAPRAGSNKRLTDRDEPATKSSARPAPGAADTTQGTSTPMSPSGMGLTNLNPYAQARPLSALQPALAIQNASGNVVAQPQAR